MGTYKNRRLWREYCMIYTYLHIETDAILKFDSTIVHYLPALSAFAGRRLSTVEFLLLEKKRSKFTDYLFFRSTSINNDSFNCDNGIL